MRSPTLSDSIDPLRVAETAPPEQPSISMLPVSVLPLTIPLKAPELPQDVPEIVPVTCVPFCWNVAVTGELAHALGTDWNKRLQVPATFA